MSIFVMLPNSIMEHAEFRNQSTAVNISQTDEVSMHDMVKKSNISI